MSDFKRKDFCDTLCDFSCRVFLPQRRKPTGRQDDRDFTDKRVKGRKKPTMEPNVGKDKKRGAKKESVTHKEPSRAYSESASSCRQA